jgi:hypothetical protein
MNTLFVFLAFLLMPGPMITDSPTPSPSIPLASESPEASSVVKSATPMHSIMPMHSVMPSVSKSCKPQVVVVKTTTYETSAPVIRKQNIVTEIVVICLMIATLFLFIIGFLLRKSIKHIDKSLKD